MSSEALIGLGSNLGDRVGRLAESLWLLERDTDAVVSRCSHAYESEPWGEAGQPLFANAVAAVRTSMPADMLLGWLLDIEDAMGRDRTGPVNGPRTIDLDLLLYGDEEWVRPHITIPHPRMLEREFVMVPLLQVAPGATLPDGTALRTLAGRATVGRIVRELGPVPGYEGPAQDERELERAEREVMLAADAYQQPDVWWDPDEEWVAVADATRQLAGRVAQLKVLMQQLHAAGVPATLDPPDAFSHTGAVPYVTDAKVRLRVPASFEVRAMDVLRG